MFHGEASGSAQDRTRGFAYRVPGRSKTHRPDTFSSVVTVDRRPLFRGDAGTLCRRDGVFVVGEGK